MQVCFSSAERATELEALVNELEAQLVEQEEQASKVIAMWQDGCTTLERQLEAHQAESIIASERLQIAEENEAKLQGTFVVRRLFSTRS
jgi:hypothetical protein